MAEKSNFILYYSRRNNSQPGEISGKMIVKGADKKGKYV